MLKNLVYFAFFTTFVVLVWVGLGIYHNFSTSTIPTNVSVQIKPLPASFNTDALDSLKTRLIVPPDLNQAAASRSAGVQTVTIQLQTTVTPSPSVEVTPTPEVVQLPVPPTSSSSALQAQP